VGTAAYFAHALAGLFGIGFSLACAVARRHDRWRDLLLDALIPVPALVLVMTWQGQDRGGGASPVGWLSHYYRNLFLGEWTSRLVDLPTLDNRALYGAGAGKIVAALLAVFVVTPVVYGLLRAWPAAGSVRSRLERLRDDPRLPVLVLVACTGAICLLAPPGLPPYWSLYQRFSALFLLGVIVLGSTLRHRVYRGRVGAVLILGAVIFHAVSWGGHIWGFAPEVKDLAALLPKPHRGSVLCAIVEEAAYRGDPEALAHVANYHTVWNGGVVASAMYDFPFSTVKRKVDGTALPKMEDCLRSAAVDVLIVRAGAGPRRAFPGFELKAKAGAWTRYGRSATAGAP
jgi:hypothetical protein